MILPRGAGPDWAVRDSVGLVRKGRTQQAVPDQFWGAGQREALKWVFKPLPDDFCHSLWNLYARRWF